MTLDPAANFCVLTVSQGYTAAAVSIVLDSADPHLTDLPDPVVDGNYNLTWWDDTTYPGQPWADPHREIVRVTGKNSATLTITRAQESTTASDKNTSGSTYRVALAVTKKLRDDLDAIAADVGTVYGWVTDYGALGDGSTDDRAAFAAAAAALTHIVIPSGTYRISSNITFGATIALEFKSGAVLSIDSGVTVTVSGTIIAAHTGIGTGSGTLTYALRTGAFRRVESAAIDVSTTGEKTVTIAHGLTYTPDASDVLLSCYRASGTNLFTAYGPYVSGTDGTNVDVSFYVQTAAAATTAKVVAWIFPA